MAAPTRTPDQRERDLATIAEMYCQRALQVDIAAKLGVSQQQISYDLRIIRKRWQKSAIRDFDMHRAEELAKIDNLEMEYWRAWKSGAPEDQRASQYLSGVMACIDRRCKLLGIDAPDRANLSVDLAFDPEGWKRQREEWRRKLNDVDDDDVAEGTPTDS